MFAMVSKLAMMSCIGCMATWLRLQQLNNIELCRLDSSMNEETISLWYLNLWCGAVLATWWYDWDSNVVVASQLTKWSYVGCTVIWLRWQCHCGASIVMWPCWLHDNTTEMMVSLWCFNWQCGVALLGSDMVEEVASMWLSICIVESYVGYAAIQLR